MSTPGTKRVTYLGDGAYADWRGDTLIIYTSDGLRTTNIVYLEPEVLMALINYLKAQGLKLT